MTKYELTEKQKNAVRLYYNHEIELAPLEVQDAFDEVIGMAIKLRTELDAIDEVMAFPGCDTIRWFINKQGIEL